MQKAINAGMDEEQAKWLPFSMLSIPDMTQTLKQWVGRLIRTTDDDGVCVILDPRLRKAKYGNKVLKALPNGYVTNKRSFVESIFRGMQGRIDVISAGALTELSKEELPF